MFPTPIAVGLTLCEQVIVEEGTRRASLINTFSRWNVAPFPSVPRPFCVVCVLVDGEGDGTIQLTVTHEDSEDLVYAVRHPVHFSDRLKEMRAVFRVQDCAFPVAGLYFAALSVDGEWVAQKRCYVY